jgi:hypothetical protein
MHQFDENDADPNQPNAEGSSATAQAGIEPVRTAVNVSVSR